MRLTLMPIPPGLAVPGTHDRRFQPIGNVSDVAAGQMKRVTIGDLDLLIAHTPAGLCVIDDRCPHMAAPLSVGSLDECVVACPLHRGRFDLQSGTVVQFPTTGGLDADGGYRAPWTPNDAPSKGDPPTDLKSMARAATRVRRLRYYPLRVTGDILEAALPD